MNTTDGLVNVTDRLFREAETLWREWATAPLADDFESRMVSAVLRFLHRTGRIADCDSVRVDRATADFAVVMMRKFWRRNARRDVARACRFSRECFTVVFLEDLALSGFEPAVLDRFDSGSDDPNGGETGRLLARHLSDLGWPAVRAWAFIWRFAGANWDDVREQIWERLGVEVSTASLRQWSVRYFDPNLPRVREFLRGLEEGIPSDRAILVLERGLAKVMAAIRKRSRSVLPRSIWCQTP